MRWVALTAALMLAWRGALTAQATPPVDQTSSFQYRLSGYYKNLFTTSSSFVTGESYVDSLNRLRLSLDSAWGNAVSVHFDFDNELHFGNEIQLPDFQLVRQRQDGTYLDLLHVCVDSDHAYWDTSLYRGYVTLQHKNATLTIGRQRIAWGTAHFWSPADLFNPISPLQVEPDERQGVDAGKLDLALPGNLAWTLVYAPQDGFNHSTAATRLASTFHNYDLSGFVGSFRRDMVAGFDFAGQRGGAGLRGEATYTWRYQSTQPNALRLAFGSDYAFANTFYLVGEYFYNQGQPAIPSGLQLSPSILLGLTHEIFTLYRHFLSGGARYNLTPLLRVEGYSVTDLQGPSTFFMPLVRYNLSSNMDLTVGGQLFASTPTGEFAGLHQLFFVEFLAHF